MKKLIVILFSAMSFALPCFAQCDESTSYSKTWKVENREKEKTKEERRKEYESLTPEQQIQSNSAIDFLFPPMQSSCGKEFSNGLAKIILNGKAGFINSKGKLVIEAKYEDAGRFSDNLAPVEFDNGKWGFIDTRGEVVINPTFDWAISFWEGRALIQIGAKWGYIDRTGRIVVEPKFDHADSFSEGLAHVQLYEKRYKSGFIDKDGNWIIPPVWDGGSSFNSGRAQVGRNIGYNNGVIVEILFIDKKGNIIFSHRYSGSLTDFSEGLMWVEKNRKYGFVDVFGKEIIELKFDDVSKFSEGLAVAKVNGKEGYIDKIGKFVIEPTFWSAKPFSEGLAYVVTESGEHGFIDRTGKMVIRLKVENVINFSAESFSEGFALITMQESAGYIDKQGNYIWKPTK